MYIHILSIHNFMNTFYVLILSVLKFVCTFIVWKYKRQDN